MAINFQKGYLFIHIPKTGGTSFYKGGILKPEQEWHLSLEDYIKKYEPEWNISAFFKFAFVRNPYDRFISGVISQIPAGVEFNEYVRGRFGLNEIQSLSVMRTQYSFVRRNGQIGVDFVGRFENLEEDWKIICKKLGIRKKLPHENKDFSDTDHCFSGDFWGSSSSSHRALSH